MTAHNQAQRWREASIRDWRGLTWPINEVLMQSLVVAGRTDTEIADLCGVDPALVTRLRDSYQI